VTFGPLPATNWRQRKTKSKQDVKECMKAHKRGVKGAGTRRNGEEAVNLPHNEILQRTSAQQGVSAVGYPSYQMHTCTAGSTIWLAGTSSFDSRDCQRERAKGAEYRASEAE
jgi:hypothetical protein